MRPRLSLWVWLFALSACSSSGTATNSSTTDGGGGDGGLNIGCVPKRCPVDKSCGVIDDGCGGKAACGSCKAESEDISNAEAAALAFAPDGQPIVALATDEGVLLATRDGDGWQTEVITDKRSEDVAIALETDGDPVVAFVQRSGAVDIARRDGGSWKAETVATPLRAWMLSLAVDKKDAAHVAFADVTGLAFLHATDASGSWQVETVEETLPVGDDVNSSLIVDASGTLHLLYPKNPQTLRYARRAGDSWQIETVSANYAGRGNALLDWQGQLHLAHYDANALRYLRREGSSWKRETISDACDDGLVALAFDRVGRLHAINDCRTHAVREAEGWTTEELDSISGSPFGLSVDERSLPVLYMIGRSGGSARVVTQLCGGCSGLRSCGAGGEANVCGCAPKSCEESGVECGSYPDDGCGGELFCGWCESDFETCGGGGVPNQCGCMPLVSGCEERSCGDLYDRCGTSYACGSCSIGTCGGGGSSGVCSCPTNTTIGPIDAGKGANDPTIGEVAWSDVNAVNAAEMTGSNPDGNAAWIEIPRKSSSDPPIISNELIVTGFAFALPPDALVNGIAVEIRAGTRTSHVIDHSIRLVKGGKPVGLNRARNDRWSGGAEYEKYGGHKYLWGRAWTVAELDDSFGVAVAVAGGDLRDEIIAFVDHVRITVYVNADSCGDRSCGTDSCGRSCGSCGAGETCEETAGVCTAPIYSDPLSGLQWQNSGGVTTSGSHCWSMALGGYDDWRLPTIDELRSLLRGCTATMTGGSCTLTDSCNLQSNGCYNADCSNGCANVGGPGNLGCYAPPELQVGECSKLVSSTKADSGNWVVNMQNARIYNESLSSMTHAAICVRSGS